MSDTPSTRSTPTNLNARTEADNDVRDALRLMSDDLATPAEAWATAAAERGRVMKKRRRIVQVVAPLAVAAVLTPVAWFGIAGLQEPGRDSDTTTAAPARPDPEAKPTGTIGATSRDSDSTDSAVTAAEPPEPQPLTASIPGSPMLPTPTGDTRHGVAPEEAGSVLSDLVAVQLQRSVDSSEVNIHASVDAVAPQAPRVSSHDVRAGIAVDDPSGVGFVYASLTGAPADPAQTVQRPCTSTPGFTVTCSDLEGLGRLTSSTETDGRFVERTISLTRPDGSEVLVSASNTDGLLPLGATITRDKPLLSLEQLQQMVLWGGWFR